VYDDIDPRNLPPGTVVDGYTLTGKLGGGGMGEIYRAQRGQEEFALKLQGERLTEAMDPVKREELEARSRREAAVLLSLSHPNILAIIGSGRWPDRGGYLYLITELVPGEPLDSWHERKKPSLRQLTRVFERVADALDYMHRAGIFHRDLKDPNVLVREDATPVVIDLGIARSAAAYTLTRVGAVIGTTTHLSPGVCRYLVSEKSHAYRFGAHDDLHALGFMLYERLTGTPPFRQRSDVEWPEFDYYRQVMEHVPQAPRDVFAAVPEVLSALTMRLLAKTPEASFPHASALQEALEQALLSAPPSWDEPFPVPRGVHRRDLTRSSPVKLPQPDDALAARPPREASRREEEKPTRVQPSPVPLDAAATRVLGKTELAIAALGQGSSQEGGPSAAVEFRPPTTLRPPPFVPPEEAAPPPAPAPRGPWSLSALGTYAQQLRPDPPRRRRLGMPQLLVLGAAVLLIAAFVVKSLGERPPPRPKSLLERYQEELATEQQAPAGPSEDVSAVPALPVGPWVPAAATTVAEGASATPRLGGKAPTAPGAHGQEAHTSPPSASEAKAIQAELELAYGNKRPTLPGKASPPSAGMPSWVKGVQVVDAKPAAAPGEKKLGGRYGDHLRLQLRSNLDSRLCGSGAVEAVLVIPYAVNGTVVLPVHTLAYGQCSAQGTRFLIVFNRLRLPDGSETHFDGVAMDVADGKPGLLATRRLGSAGASLPQEGVEGTVARGAASTILGAGTAGGSVGAQVANGAGQTVLSARPEVPPSGSESAILLDAGGGVDVFVRQPF
jgi:serine/threonine protein kinase